jgi:LacI family transcriptional regulator
MSRPTVKDIAKHAEVSLATVDRVINGRAGVRKSTIARVYKTIEEIGYVRDIDAANLARRREYKMLFVLAEGDNRFSTAVENKINEFISGVVADRTVLELIKAPENDFHKVATILNSLSRNSYDGIVIMASETALVRDAIRHLKKAGFAVVTLVSDLPDSGRDHYVGINNVAAGRIAGFLMSRFLGKQGGKVLITSSSMRLRDSVERRLGFDSYILEKNQPINALPTLEGHSSTEILTNAVKNALSANPDIRGFYSAGAGITALLGLLQKFDLTEDTFVIAHDLTPQTRAGLEDETIDAVISQDVGHMVRSAIRVLKAISDGTEIDPAQELIRIDIVLKENLFNWN